MAAGQFSLFGLFVWSQQVGGMLQQQPEGKRGGRNLSFGSGVRLKPRPFPLRVVKDCWAGLVVAVLRTVCSVAGSVTPERTAGIFAFFKKQNFL